jgi:hypothetical protein
LSIHGASDQRAYERGDPSAGRGLDLKDVIGEDLETELLAEHPKKRELGIGHSVVVIEHHGQARRSARR